MLSRLAQWHVSTDFGRFKFGCIIPINHMRTPLAVAIIHNRMKMRQKRVNHYLSDKT
jgi:hypothetical protein